MLTRRVIPCLDIQDGRVVKGVRFQGLRDAGDPVAQAQRYAQEGADEIVLLDVSATRAGRSHAVRTVAAVRQVLDIPLCVGGGVRSVQDAGRLLNAGADKVAVNSAALARPELIQELSSRFGRQCTVLSIDARQRGTRFEVLTHAGTRVHAKDAVAWAVQGQALGAGEILLTSWDRDGTGEGYQLALLQGVCAAVGIPVVASGGAQSPDHMSQALRAGAQAVLAATLFHDRAYSVAAVKSHLAELGWEIRPC